MGCATINKLLMGAGLALLLTITSCGGSSSTPPSQPPPPPPPPPPLTTVAVTPATATLYRGEQQQFAAQVSGQTDQSVTWSVDTHFGSIDSTGLYTAPANFDGGDIFVTATSKADPTALGTATVTLPKVSFTIAPGATAILPGGSQTFLSTVIGLDNSQVTWTVQGTGSGTITSDGIYTAPATTGIYYVVATSAINTNYSATAAVLVTTTPTSFSPTGDLNRPRQFHTATLLANGKTLVAGGAGFGAYCYIGTDPAELYDATTGSFALTENMSDRRYAQTSTRLQDGKVLITGGFSFNDVDCFDLGTSPALTSAELYDPSTDSFAPAGNMTEERGVHTATLLSDGNVLITGGGRIGGNQPPFADEASAAAEVYNHATGIFRSTGHMTTARMGQTATLLADGKVLIAGGLTSPSADPLATAELYDPNTGVFTPVGNMTAGRAGHTATLLQDGMVLITGGFNDRTLAPSDTAEIYDPATNSFEATGPMSLARWSHSATLLPDGTVLVVGGGTVISEIYDPSTGSFSPGALTQFDRSGHTATPLLNGTVIVIGGSASPTTAELYP